MNRKNLALGCALMGAGLVIMVIAASGDGSSASGTPDSVHKWYATGGDLRITSLSDDFQTISSDAYAMDTASLADDCETLSSDVKAARSFAKIPDPETQTHWSSALGHFDKAASDCHYGAVRQDASLINTGAAEMTKGQADLNLATARLEQLNSPSKNN